MVDSNKSRKKEFLRDDFWSSPVPLESTAALFMLGFTIVRGNKVHMKAQKPQVAEVVNSI